MKKASIIITIVILALIASNIYFYQNSKTISPIEKLSNADITSNDEHVLQSRIIEEPASPPLRASIKGSIYEINETLTTLGVCSNLYGIPVSSTANLKIYDPNNNILTDINLTQNNTGMFFYSTITNFSTGTHFIEFTCYGGTDTARVFGEFQIPTWTQRILTSYNEILNIANEEQFSANLETQNSIFPNDEIRFEATFTQKDGQYLTNVTSINLTVYDPNENSYLSVDESSFSISPYGVYEYDYSVGASPTTGQYRAHLAANYQNITQTTIHQFRITSGAIFRYTVTTPLAVCLKSTSTPLAVTNIITNEGDVGTETSCINYVDINQNNIRDSNEPEESFSKYVEVDETLEFNTRVKIHDLREGIHTLRGECNYIGSAQPNATASTTFTVERCGLPTGLAVTPITPSIKIVEVIKENWIAIIISILTTLLVVLGFKTGWLQRSFSFCISLGPIGVLIVVTLAFISVYFIIKLITGG